MLNLHGDSSDMKFTEQVTQNIKREIGCDLKSDNIRITSCHLECGVVVVGCINALTKKWFKKQTISLKKVKKGVKS